MDWILEVAKHWQALLPRLRLSEESNTVDSAAVITEDIDSKEDAELLEMASATK